MAATQLAQDIYKKIDAKECDVGEMRILCAEATTEDANWHNPRDVR
jgi:hypothetical protein